MGHSLNRTNLTISNNFIINNSNTQDDYILVSGTSGEANWDLTSKYVTSKSFDHYIGELYGGGVVTAVWKENDIEKCLVVAPQDCRTLDQNVNGYFIDYSMRWSNVISTYSGASYSSLGASNSVIIASQPGFDAIINPPNNQYSGSVQYCLNYSNPDLNTGVWDDWFLPSINELNSLKSNLGIVNKVLYQYSIDSGITLNDSIDPMFGVYNRSSINLIDNQQNLDDGYWSSTERSPTASYYLALNSGGLKPSVDVKTNFKRVRPFRIADDTQVFYKFDADYIVISYLFTDGADLDTSTRMVYPNATTTNKITPWTQSIAYNMGVNGGTNSSNYIGYSSQRPWMSETSAFDYTPGATSTLSPPSGYYNTPGVGNNINGTYSILWSSGDNQGSAPAYEEVILNISAFKFHFPGENEIIIDCRADWYTTIGTKPVILGVDLYKGGQMQRHSNTGGNDPNYYIWTNPTATATSSIASYGKVITSINTTGDTSNRVARVKYNIVTKNIQLLID